MVRHIYIPLSDVPQVLIEITGVTRKQQAVYMWIHKGRISHDGRLIKLRAKKRLGTWYTTREWVEQFCLEVG